MVYTNGPDHITKMPTTSIYGYTPFKIFSSRTRRQVDLGCWLYHVCSNDDTRLTLTYFTARSNLFPVC